MSTTTGYRPLQSAQRDLRWMIAPVDFGTFAQSYWATAPLIVKRNSARYFDPLLTEEYLEYALYAAARIPGALEEMTGEERPRRCSSYQAAIDAFRRGKSLRVDAIQRFSRELLVLSRDLEQELSCPVNINMYLTPAARQALARHYDTHDVFVLQIHGQKKWRVFGSPVAFPLEYLPPLRCEHRTKSFRLKRHTNDVDKDKLPLKEEFILEAGDVLYLPRGFWHEAEAVADQVSCHLTVGVQSLTYADLLTVAIAQAASANSDLRQSLPLGFATHTNGLPAVQQHLANILPNLGASLEVERSLSEVSEIFIRSRQPFNSRLLHSAKPVGAGQDSIQLNSKIVIQPGFVCRVASKGPDVSLTFGSTTVSLPISFTPALQFIARTRQFSPGEIPGSLTDPERIALVQHLIAEGLLCTAANTGTPRQKIGTPSGWLPIKLTLAPKASVKWMYFGDEPLAEPFFAQSVARIRSSARTRSRVTSITALSRIDESIVPSGFIFHISRCGSTLLSNALRKAEETIVISEAQPIGEAIAAWESEPVAGLDTPGSRDELLKGVIRAFGQPRNGATNTVIKFSSWNILHLAVLRRLWPSVPVVILIRDPLEVMVSSLEQPPGWMRFKRMPSLAGRRFGWSEEAVATMVDERFCAKAIGSFLNAASENLGPSCRILDYADLSKDTILWIADFFGISGLIPEALETTLSTYSKDPQGSKTFVDDRQRKQSLITDLMRSECLDWAQNAYMYLRNHKFSVPKRTTHLPVGKTVGI
jgi:lysine-specific demethylase/histidyl-hydroxylase NO66